MSFINPFGRKSKVDQDNTYFDLLNTIKIIWEDRIDRKHGASTTYPTLYNQRITKMSSKYWNESKANYEKAVDENTDPRYVEEVSLSDNEDDWFDVFDPVDGTRDRLDDDVLWNYDSLLTESGYLDGYPADPHSTNPFNILDHEKWDVNFDVLKHSKIWRRTPEIVEIRTERRIGDYFYSDNDAWNDALNSNTTYESWDPRTESTPSGHYSTPRTGWRAYFSYDLSKTKWSIFDKTEFDIKVDIDGIPVVIDDYVIDQLSHRVFLYHHRDTGGVSVDVDIYDYPIIETNIHINMWDLEDYDPDSSARNWFVTNHEYAPETNSSNIWTIEFSHHYDSIPDIDNPPAHLSWSGSGYYGGSFVDYLSLESNFRPLYLYRDLTNVLINEPT